MTSIRISVVRTGSESTPSLIRRFSKRVQGSGIIRKVKGSQYFERALSKKKQHNAALRRIARDEKRATMERQGLIEPRDPRTGRAPRP